MYGYSGDFYYDTFSGSFVLQTYSGQTLTARRQNDGPTIITGRLEPDTPVLTLRYGPQQ